MGTMAINTRVVPMSIGCPGKRLLPYERDQGGRNMKGKVLAASLVLSVLAMLVISSVLAQPPEPSTHTVTGNQASR